MSESKLMRLPVINPLPDTQVLVKLDDGEFLHELQDGNQFYLMATDKGIVCVSSQEREDNIINELSKTFGIDEVFNLRIRFIKVTDDPNQVIPYLEDTDPTSDGAEIMANGELVKTMMTNARVVRFPGTNETFDMVKVSKNILNLEKKDG